jgi:excisionase family DNA binding protein
MDRIITKNRMLPKEAAEYIGAGYDKLMQMVRLKQIPHYRIGRRVLFTKEALDEWIQFQERQSVSCQGEER